MAAIYMTTYSEVFSSVEEMDLDWPLCVTYEGSYTYIYI